MILTFQDVVVHLTISMAPIIDEALGTNVFPYSILGFVITGMKYELLTKFIKIKPPIF